LVSNSFCSLVKKDSAIKLSLDLLFSMAVSDQAPALELEPIEEKKKVVTEDDFEERLAEIRKY
jgi:hypothetical protein